MPAGLAVSQPERSCMAGRPTACTGGGTNMALAMPSVEVAVTVPSSSVTVTAQSAPLAGHEKRIPPTSRCSPAGTVSVPAGLAVSQPERSCMPGRPTACTGGGTSMALAMPSVEVAATVPSSAVTVTAQSAPPAGQLKRTPPTSRCSPAGTVTLPAGVGCQPAGEVVHAGQAHRVHRRRHQHGAGHAVRRGRRDGPVLGGHRHRAVRPARRAREAHSAHVAVLARRNRDRAGGVGRQPTGKVVHGGQAHRVHRRRHQHGAGHAVGRGHRDRPVLAGHRHRAVRPRPQGTRSAHRPRRGARPQAP